MIDAWIFTIPSAVRGPGEDEPKTAMKAGKQLREPVRVLMHLNGGYTLVSVERTEGHGMADGGFTWDIATDDIPRHLRAIGSRFLVVMTITTPEADDSIEELRRAAQTSLHIEELNESDAE